MKYMPLQCSYQFGVNIAHLNPFQARFQAIFDHIPHFYSNQVHFRSISGRRNGRNQNFFILKPARHMRGAFATLTTFDETQNHTKLAKIPKSSLRFIGLQKFSKQLFYTFLACWIQISYQYAKVGKLTNFNIFPLLPDHINLS